MYVQLIKDAALLIALTSLHSMLSRLRFRSELWPRLLSGLLFGGVAVAGMAMPFQFQPGVIYDGRSIILVLAGLFGGTISTIVASVLAGVYRAALGGAGVWAGLSSIVGPALLGLAFRRGCRGRPEQLGVPALYGMGIAAHVLMLACQLLVIPWPTGLGAIGRIWLPVMIVFPVATVVMALLLQTESKRALAESALRESEDRFKRVFESANAGKSVTLPTGEVNVNGAFAAMLGYTKDQLRNRRWQDLTPPEDVPEIQRLLDPLLRGERDSARFDKRYVHRNGSYLWGDASVAIRRDAHGNPLHFITTVVDITARRRAEEELRESESRYRTLFEESPVAIRHEDFSALKARFDEVRRAGATDLRAWFEARPDEVAEFAARVRLLAENRRSVELFGGDGPQPLPREASHYRPGGSHAMFADELVALFEGRHSYRAEIAKVNARGERLLIDLTLSVPAEHADDLASVLVCFVDVTEQRRTEEQLRQALKMETVGQLAGGIAHDFNNMLQVILGSVEMGLETVARGSALEQHLRDAQRAAQRSADMTGQLLAFARRQTVRPRVVDLNEVVARARTMIQRLIGEDIDFAWTPGHGLGKVKIDPAQVDQILANLSVNARDAIAGVGRLSVETANVILDEAWCARHPGFEAGEYIQLAVTDNGRGMDRETMGHLFEPFFTTKGLGKGTGLGLATIYGIVKQNRGFIDAFSAPGHGTTFHVYLPRVHDDAEAGVPGAEDAREPRRGTETLLVVEDEEAILELARHSLQGLGYVVLTARSPGEALEVAGSHVGPLDLLITDVVLPRMNGRELCERLSAAWPGLKCLFMSGYTTDVIAHRGVLDDGVRFLPKPFTLSGLAEKVRDALDGAREA